MFDSNKMLININLYLHITLHSLKNIQYFMLMICCLLPHCSCGIELQFHVPIFQVHLLLHYYLGMLFLWHLFASSL